MNYSIVLRFTFVLIGISLVLGFFIFAYQLMLPVIFGWVLSILLYHPSRWLHQLSRIPFPMSIFLTIMAFCSLIISTFVVTGFLFWTDLLRLIEKIPELFNRLSSAIKQSMSTVLPLLEKGENWLNSKGLTNDHTTDSLIENLEHQAVTIIQKAGEILFMEVSAFITSLPSFLFSGIIAFISAYFFIKEKEQIQSLLNKFMSPAVTAYKRKMSKAIRSYTWSYIQAQMLLTSITAAIVLIGLLILNMDGAPAIALISAILDLIPLVGTGLIFIPWIFYCWFSGMKSIAIGLLIIQCTIMIARQILEPKIIGQSMGIHPFITFLLIYISFDWFGVRGVILSPLLLLTISTLIKAGTFSLIWQYIKKGRVHFS